MQVEKKKALKGWSKILVCSSVQVSYFEIYLDKIRDLLDGKCATLKIDIK